MTALKIIHGMAGAPALADQDDGALMLLTAAGRVDAFTVLVARHEAALRRFLGRLVGVAEADDLCQDTFLELWRRRARYREQGKFRALLYRVARSKAMSHLRWRGVRRRFATREQAQTRPSLAPVDASALGSLIAQERDEGLSRAVARLPFKLREAVVMHYAEGLDYATMASITGATESALRVRAHRGIALLRQRLTEQEPS